MNSQPASRTDQANPVTLLQSAPSPNREGASSFSAMLERNASPQPARQEHAPSADNRTSHETRKEQGREPVRERETRAPDQASHGERRHDDSATAQRRGTDRAEDAATSKTEQAGAADPKSVPAEAEGSEELPAGFAAISAILAAFDTRRTAAATGDNATGTLLDGEEADANPRSGKILMFGLGLSADDGDTSTKLKAATPSFGTGVNTAPGSFNAALAARAEATLSGFQSSAQGEAPLPGTALTGNLVAASRTESTPLPQLQVTTPAGQRAWAEDVGNRMLWMIGRNESKAELVLTPPSLGKLGVSIQVNGDQTTAHFVAATQAAREALEQAMPRLREVLQQAGIQLGQTNVSTSDQHQAQSGGDNNGRSGPRAGGPASWQLDDDGSIMEPGPTRWTSTGNGMIDLFA